MGRNSTFLLLLAVFVMAGLFTFCSCSDELVKPPPEPPVHVQQDTTSHDITWEVFRFGYPPSNPSIFRDVYALSDSDVWAVGSIEDARVGTIDSVGKFIQPFNAVHWDGKAWTLHRINAELLQEQPAYTELYTVWAFEPKHVFFCNGRDYFSVFDGNKSIKKKIPVMAVSGPTKKMWGKSKEEYYLCGYNGSLTHYYDGQFHRIVMPTDCDLNDVYGTADGHVWTGGYDYTTEKRAFVHIDNGKLKNEARDKIFRGARSIFVTKDTVYAFFGNGVKIQSIRDTSHWWYTPFDDVANFIGFTESMRGSGDNNIFAAGHYATILHYNGRTWKLVHDGGPSNDTIFYAVYVTSNKVYVVGKDYATWEAVIYIGTRK